MLIEANKAAAPVLILGRPNVGKSTLFNRLLGQRRSIVGDEPGITRDRIYGEVEWQGRRFDLIDTGGILLGDDAFIPSRIFDQVSFALTESSIVLFVVDARDGITSADEQLAKHLHRWGGRVILLANKADSPQLEMNAEEFRRLGFERTFPIAAEHGRGIGEMLDALVDELPVDNQPVGEAEAPEIKVAVIGRPNVGKSSLVNALLGAERVIVSPVPGTTRDAVDTVLTTGGRDFRLIDTAGIRKRSHIQAKAEQMSVLMAERHMQRADVAILLIDGLEGPTATDAAVAGMGSDAGKSMILAVNKWDLVTKSKRIGDEFEERVRDRMKFLDYAPIVFISALNSHRVERLLPLAVRAYEARHLRISTGELNRVFEEILSDPRAVDVAKSLRLHYITQAATDPPTFVVFVAAKFGKVGESFQRYLERQLRARYEFFATPIRVRLRRR